MFSVIKNLIRPNTLPPHFDHQNKNEMASEDKTGSFIQEKSESLFGNHEKKTNLLPAKINQSSFVKKGAAVIAAGLGAKLLVDAYSKTTIAPQEPSSNLGYAIGGTFLLLATTFAAYKYGKSQKSKQNQQSSTNSENPDTSSQPKQQYRIVKIELPLLPQPSVASNLNTNNTPSSLNTTKTVIEEKPQEKNAPPSSTSVRRPLPSPKIPLKSETSIAQEESKNQQSPIDSENSNTSSKTKEPSKPDLESNTNTNNTSLSANETETLIEEMPIIHLKEENEKHTPTPTSLLHRPLPIPKILETTLTTVTEPLKPEISILQENSENHQSSIDSENSDTSPEPNEFEVELENKTQKDETNNQPSTRAPLSHRPLPIPKILETTLTTVTEPLKPEISILQEKSENHQSSTDSENPDTSPEPNEFEVELENKTQKDETNNQSLTDSEKPNTDDNSRPPSDLPFIPDFLLNSNHPDNSIPHNSSPSDLQATSPVQPIIELSAEQMKSLTSINYLCQEIFQTQNTFLQQLDTMLKIKRHFTDEKIAIIVNSAPLDKQEDLRQLLTALLHGGNIEACRKFVGQLINTLTPFAYKEDKDTLLAFADTYLNLNITNDFFIAVLNHIQTFTSIQNDEKEIQTAWNIEIKKCLPLNYTKYINLTDPFAFIHQQFARYQLLAIDLHKAILQAKDNLQIDEQLLNSLTNSKENLVKQISLLNEMKKKDDEVILGKAEEMCKLVKEAKSNKGKILLENKNLFIKKPSFSNALKKAEHDPNAIEMIKETLKTGIAKAISLKHESKDDLQKALDWLNKPEKKESKKKAEKASNNKEEIVLNEEKDKPQKKDSKIKLLFGK